MAERLHELIAQQASHIAYLEAELVELRRHTCVTKASDRHGALSDKQTSVSTPGLPYDELLTQHRQLQAQHASCEAQIAKVNRDYAKAKEKVKQWHAYIQQQMAKKSSRLSSPSIAKLLDAADDVRSSCADSKPLTAPALDLKDRAVADSADSGRHGRQQYAHIATQIGSSQSTVPELEDNQPRCEPLDGDEDTVTITHTTSKRRRITQTKSVKIKQEPGTPQQPITLASDPADERSVRTKRREELRDLDDLPRALPTKSSATKVKRPPLRSLPIDELRMDSFKLNPRFTGPYLRMRDPNSTITGRRCPPDCKRHECCGDKIHRMIEREGVPKSAPSDEKVLSDFLGPQWRSIMATYEPERRKDVLTHAHAVSIAAMTYKRPTNDNRATTPPGFWRTDMPSTQENAEDVHRAEQMERSKVKERWQEAMRHNGRWMFRDES